MIQSLFNYLHERVLRFVRYYSSIEFLHFLLRHTIYIQDKYNSERVLQLLPVLTGGFDNSSATMGTRWLHSQAHPVQYKRELTTEEEDFHVPYCSVPKFPFQ